MKTCPHCGSSNRIRRRRTNFTKHLPFVKRYNCLDCRKDYYWFSFLNVPLKAKAS